MMCDIISASAAKYSHFRSPATSYLSYLGNIFWVHLSWPPCVAMDTADPLMFSGNDPLFQLRRHCASSSSPVVSPAIQSPSALGAHTLSSGLCWGVHQGMASKSLVSIRTSFTGDSSVSPEPSPHVKMKAAGHLHLEVLVSLQSIQNSSHYPSFLRLVPSALPAWETGVIIYPHTHGRSLEATHNSSPFDTHSEFSFLLPSSLFPLLYLVYTPRVTAVASLPHLAFCFTLSHHPSMFPTEWHSQKTSEPFTPLFKVLWWFPQNLQIHGVQGQPPNLAPGFSTASVPTLPPQTLPKHRTSKPWNYLRRDHALCAPLGLYLA